ncbi:MAG: ATP-binding protein, partial [Planctomycetota bacterium]
CGLIVLSILDGFHSVVSNDINDIVVWMRSSAALGSSFFFALCWLPDRMTRRTGSRFLSFGTAILALLFGAVFLIWPAAVPSMVQSGNFTATTLVVNFIAAVLYLLAALRFFIQRRSKRGDTADILFIIFFVALAVASLGHPFSRAWDWNWWGWHTSRLFGYIVIGMYLSTKYFYLLENIRRSNRALSLISECNQTLVRAADEQTFLNDICRIAVELGGYRLAWVGFLNEDKQSALSVASAGFKKGVMENARITLSDTQGISCPIRATLQNGKISILNIGRTDQPFSHCCLDVDKGAYKSIIALPLFEGLQLFGSFNIYSAEPDAFNNEELKLFTELALDLGYGIANLRARKKQAQTNQALEQSEKKYHNLVEHALVGVYQTTLQGEILYANNALIRMFGYDSLEEFIKIGAIAQYKEPSERQRLIKSLKQDGFVNNFESQFVTRTGQTKNVIVSAKLEGATIVGMVRDITEHKKLEAQLVQAQKLESVGTLAGGIAHDFNNMLGAIKGFAELSLMDTDKTSPIYDYLKHIVTSTDRAGILTRQLLIFSRSHSAELQPLNLNENITNMLKMLTRLIGEDIKIETKLAPDIATIKADAGNIEQVLMNLCVNARDAIHTSATTEGSPVGMPKGGTITIKTENVAIDEKYCELNIESHCGNFVMLTVADTGSGMTKEVMEHIFEPFYTTKPQGKGTGLGLSVVYGIVKKHNGWINVYSELGQGAVFKIYLPATTAGSPVGKSDTRIIPPEQLRGKGERVLVIEDDDGIRNLVTNALAKMNYQVFTAASGDQARAIFAREKGDFRLIISDVVLTDTNGVDLCDELIQHKPGICVLLSSGYASKGAYSEQIHQRGLNFIPKPYKL